MLVVIAVAIAGCSGTSPTTPATGGTPKATNAAGAPSGTTSVSSGGSISGGDLFGGLGYNWVEYKMSTGSGSDAMTIYYKWNKQTGNVPCDLKVQPPRKCRECPPRWTVAQRRRKSAERPQPGEFRCKVPRSPIGSRDCSCRNIYCRQIHSDLPGS